MYIIKFLFLLFNFDFLGTAIPYFEVGANDGVIRKASFRQLESGKTYDLEVEARDAQGQRVKNLIFLLQFMHFLHLNMKF